MPKHEFGLMDNPPFESERFDEYIPEKYANLISVEDSVIVQISGELNEVQMYWHTLENPQNGLAYNGITLISPESASKIQSITGRYPKLGRLTRLMEKAMTERKYIIHFGI